MEMGDAAPFPWAQAIHAGLCLLRLDPKTFWALSPSEFHAMTGGAMPKVTLQLVELMARYPDRADGSSPLAGEDAISTSWPKAKC